MTENEQHLKLLSTFHYIVGGLGALFACFPLIHVTLGIMMIVNPDFLNNGHKGPTPPAFVGYLFILMGGFFVLCGWAAAICTIISGRYLARRKKRMFSFVMAAILCMFVPFGTVLGVFTIIVLSKESVQKLYGHATSQQSSQSPLPSVTPPARQEEGPH
jgi:MFS family permease